MPLPADAAVYSLRFHFSSPADYYYFSLPLSSSPILFLMPRADTYAAAFAAIAMLLFRHACLSLFMPGFAYICSDAADDAEALIAATLLMLAVFSLYFAPLRYARR